MFLNWRKSCIEHSISPKLFTEEGDGSFKRIIGLIGFYSHWARNTYGLS